MLINYSIKKRDYGFKKNAGFTLFEMIIYIALFSLIITSSFIIAIGILQGSDKLNTNVSTQAEGNFVLKKLEWALSSISSVAIPSAGTPVTTTLRVIKYDGTQVDVQLGTDHIEIRVGGAGGTFLPITTENVSISGLEFTYIPSSQGSMVGVNASTTLNEIPFNITGYKRK